MGGFVYMFLGMSKDITVGPTAIMSLLVAGYGEPLGDAADDLNDPTYAILLAFFCGIVQLFMGIFHLGKSNRKGRKLIYDPPYEYS